MLFRKRKKRIIEAVNLQGTGSRAEQQDSFGSSLLSDYYEKGILTVLCDGMGGMEAGREISQYCVRAILERFPLPADRDKIAAFDQELLHISSDIHSAHRGHGGCTLILCYLSGNELWFRCIGDSDLFLIRNEFVYALNEHHTYGNELLRRSIPEGIDAEQSLNDPQAGALIGYMGCEKPVLDRNRSALKLIPGDVIFLCSDGVSQSVSRTDIAQICIGDIQKAPGRLEEIIYKTARPDQDNYTAVIWKYNG